MFLNCAVKFQFHKGTIRTKSVFGMKENVSNFNSIKVRLEQQKGFPMKYFYNNFNSIKVRLELPNLLLLRRLSRFQFHKGTIRTPMPLVSQNLQAHFNSIKVRLEPRCKFSLRHYLIFQFHKGTIRTDNDIDYDEYSEISIP